MSEEVVMTPSFGKDQKDFYTLLKERIAKSTNNIETKEYEKILGNNKTKHHKKSKKKFLSHKIPLNVPNIDSENDNEENNIRSEIGRNVYTREHMFKFLIEKEKAFKGENLENESIDGD